mmetsp:Transcript_10510/g.31650  ORF Transcript_10510/g.31650 Transcript_10510/m.31650 type:complete len:175 (-) Transcript_10510:1981-2505(-)
MLARTLRQASDLCKRAVLHPAVLRGSGAALQHGPDSGCCCAQCRAHGSSADPNAEKIHVTFYDEKDKSEKTVLVPIGENLLEAAHSNDIDLEGACEGSLACSTCHVIVEDQQLYDSLPEPDDDENDMLDLAFGLTETSRLGCQVIASKELDGLRVRIPSATRNFAVDGHVPKPH